MYYDCHIYNLGRYGYVVWAGELHLQGQPLPSSRIWPNNVSLTSNPYTLWEKKEMI